MAPAMTFRFSDLPAKVRGVILQEVLTASDVIMIRLTTADGRLDTETTHDNPRFNLNVLAANKAIRHEGCEIFWQMNSFELRLGVGQFPSYFVLAAKAAYFMVKCSRLTLSVGNMWHAHDTHAGVGLDCDRHRATGKDAVIESMNRLGALIGVLRRAVQIREVEIFDFQLDLRGLEKGQYPYCRKAESNARAEYWVNVSMVHTFLSNASRYILAGDGLDRLEIESEREAIGVESATTILLLVFGFLRTGSGARVRVQGTRSLVGISDPDAHIRLLGSLVFDVFDEPFQSAFPATPRRAPILSVVQAARRDQVSHLGRGLYGDVGVERPKKVETLHWAKGRRILGTK